MLSAQHQADSKSSVTSSHVGITVKNWQEYNERDTETPSRVQVLCKAQLHFLACEQALVFP